ncbi:DUF3530 family protein [Neptunomonas qingdaonensis]|uniref:DUF3530 family protein n=1 Tax=Neptunomonas qingdaonensis TaxID=1045558 RepID=A0A1I2MV90_9GAMM|nr:DUF3530 family protein [Neptunomonas qingdaonensis]SFF95392.1 Protein of unknown function [Neptunomonas qingdaonensis]
MKIKTPNYRLMILSLLWLISGGVTSSFAEETPAGDTQTPAPPTETIKANRIVPDKQASLLADVSKELMSSETEILDLNAGEDNFKAYYRNRSGALSHGGIIFFPDDYTHPNWPIFIEPLRTGLSEFGWSTLAIPLPAPVTRANPIRTLPSLKAIRSQPSTDTEDSTATPESTTPIEQNTTANTTPTTPLPASQESESESESEVERQSSEAYQQILQRGMTALQALQQKGMDRFILAGAGTGATWATALALDLQAQANMSLLIINAQQSPDISAPKLLDLIPELELTTLDIYTDNPGSSSRSHKSYSRLRLETARRNNLTNINNYHQSRLPATSNTLQGQEWLIRYTRGLLETYIVKAEKEAISIPSTPAPSINQPPGTPVPPQNKQANPI